MKNKFFKQGFTLVELMVTISIIGILSAVVYANFSDSKKIARDEIRKTTLKDLQLAINLYKAQNGSYPMACDGVNKQWRGSVNGAYKCTDGKDYISGLTPDFIATLPVDPLAKTYAPASNVGYLYMSNGIDYKLMSNNAVEKETITVDGQDFARCPDFNSCGSNLSASKTTYAVYSNGAQTW